MLAGKTFHSFQLDGILNVFVFWHKKYKSDILMWQEKLEKYFWCHNQKTYQSKKKKCVLILQLGLNLKCEETIIETKLKW